MSILGIFSRLFGKKAPKGPECVACGARELETIAPDAYRCTSCSHEGGDGYPAYVAGRETERLVGLPADQLRAHALKRLEDARLGLVGLVGEVGEGASFTFSVSFSGFGGAGGGEDMANERDLQQMRFDRAVGELHDARPSLAALKQRGAGVSDTLAELDRQKGHAHPIPSELLTLCMTAMAQVEAWRG